MPLRRPPFPRRTRGPLHRPARPGVPGVVHQALMRANRAMATGAHADAARIYGRLADEAKRRGRLRPGVAMDLEAVRAHLAAGDYDGAQHRATHALIWLLDAHKLPWQICNAVDRIATAMERAGAVGEAGAFRARVVGILETHGYRWEDLLAGPPAGTRPTGRLPAACPACAAPLRSDELEWLEPDRVQCTYCGSVVLAE